MVRACAARLVEIGEQPNPPAVARFGQRQHRVELRTGQPLVAVVGVGVIDQPALLHHIGQAVGHPGFGRESVATGTTGLLEIAFDALRHVQVSDEPHVGLVDAHAEGDRRDDHATVVALEARLVGRPR